MVLLLLIFKLMSAKAVSNVLKEQQQVFGLFKRESVKRRSSIFTHAPVNDILQQAFKNQGNTKLKKKVIKGAIIECNKCEEGIYINDIFEHLEFKCMKFLSPRVSKLKLSLKAKHSTGKIIINSISTPYTEQPDDTFFAKELESHNNIQLASNNIKDYKLGNKLSLVWKAEINNIALGKVPIKSNLFCCFSYFEKGKPAIYLIAYRVDNNTVEVIDIINHSIIGILNKHRDAITEVRSFKLNDQTVLVTSSYDGLAIIWEVPSFKPLYEISNGTWVNSSVISNIESEEFLFSAVGFHKTSLIRAFSLKNRTSTKNVTNSLNTDLIQNNLSTNRTGKEKEVLKPPSKHNSMDKIPVLNDFIINESLSLKNNISNSINFFQLENSTNSQTNSKPKYTNKDIKVFEITFPEEVTPIIMEKYSKGKTSYLFIGTDENNPKLFIFDLMLKKFVKTFSMTNYVTNICPICIVTNRLLLYVSDITGTILEIDICLLKQLSSFNAGKKIFDFINFDSVHLFSCGEKTGSISAYLRHKHCQVKIFQSVSDKTIINIQKMYVKGSGNCIFTLSADKTIRVLKCNHRKETIV